MPPDPRRVKALFNAALDLADPADRLAFLDRECGADPVLRARVEELLAAHDRPASALGRPLVGDEAATALAGETMAMTSPPCGMATPPDFGRETVADASRPPTPPARTPPGGEGATPPPLPAGGLIAGRYKIREEIGEGGMGSVYLADQVHPVKRRVALKLIKPGMDSKTVLARFEAERQALAVMDHPHIAKVLDAGTTDQGRPFFVMELVKGIPLTDYCDQNRLDLPRRLALFRQICAAVQHAHQKGIIHRDLKPTNILVEDHDGNPIPKVIDFGLAKATGGVQLGEHTVYSAFGSVAGTPLYMAPEQATFNALDVDTRADIYALGVILYELLAGSTPIQKEALKRSALDEMLRVIREDEPPTPSHRISTSEGLPSLAANRHVEPAKLGRLVRGELDWIVMKALSKERARRYDSAIGLANDVERYQNHEPVVAGPPSGWYRARKFARRHRGRVLAASLVLLALVGGIIGTTLGLVEADRQKRNAVAAANEADRQKQKAIASADEQRKARQAEAIQRQRAEEHQGQAEEQRSRAERRLAQIEKINDILGSIFRDLNPKNAEKDGKPLSAVLGERLGQAAEQIEGEAIGDPLTVARVQLTLGRSLNTLGHAEEAARLFVKARATFAARLGPDHRDTLASMDHLADAYRSAGKLDLALPLFEQALAARRAKLGPDHPESLNIMNNLALAYRSAGKLDLALPLFEQALAGLKEKLGPDHPDTLAIMNNLATTYRSAGKLDLALPLSEQVLAGRRATLGPDHPDTLASMGNLASGYQSAGKLDLALPLFEQALAGLKEKLGPDHPDTLAIMNNLATTYRSAGKLDLALPLSEQALAGRKAKLGLDHPDTLNTMNNLAFAYRSAGKLDLALPLSEQVMAGRRAKLGPDHPHTLVSMDNLIFGYKAAGKLDKSLTLLRDRAEIEKRKAGPDSLPYAGVLAAIAKNQLDQRLWDEAEPVIRESLAIREAKEPDGWPTFYNKAMLGAALLGQGKLDLAGPLLRDGYEGMKQRGDKIPPAGKPRLADALDRLIAWAEAAGKPDQAQAWKDEKAKLYPDAPKSGGAKP